MMNLLEQIFNSTNKKILVIGDIILDEYILGSVERISPEAPIPVVKKTSEKYQLGGAANVVENIILWGVSADLMGAVGSDEDGSRVLKMLKEIGLRTDFIYKHPKYKTTKKTRIVSEDYKALLRVDTEEHCELLDIHRKGAISYIKLNTEYSAIIVSDYEKGFITREFMKAIINITNDLGIPLFVDPKLNDSKYKNSFCIKPNMSEFSNMVKEKVDCSNIYKYAVDFKLKNNISNIIITCGKKGAILLDENNREYFAKAENVNVYDVTGAGDIFLATYVVAKVCQLENFEALSLATQTSSWSVMQNGVGKLDIKELIHSIMEIDRTKYISNKSAKKLANFHRRIGDSIIFTNGCFDLIHEGHVKYLKEANSLGDVLFVGLNSDESIKRLKGENRPILPLESRIQVLSALEFIDYIVVFDGDTPEELIKEVLPDQVVKGGDYKPQDIAGYEIVSKYGGKVQSLSFVSNISTSKIIERINKIEGV